MNRDSSFLTHAVSAPEFTSDKARRPRLTRELQDYLDRDLILVVAPAGYGKTTFLADFTEQTDQPVCWIRLSPADQDPARLASVVWESLCRRFRRLRSELSLSSEVGLTPQALARSIGEAVGKKVPEAFVLIIDDFHLIHPSEEATRFVDGLLTELPSSATLIVASRELPRLSLAQWIANDQVKTFGLEELALTRDELNDLVQVRTGSPLDSEIAGEVLAETEGWVTGVLLSERLLGRALPTLTASEQPLAYDYLAQAAFHRESPEVQTFMVRSAVMPIMTAEACDRVLQRSDSQTMLSRLLRRGLFVSATGGSPRIYEYHHLFRAFLVEQLEREDPDLATELRLAAADHFSEADWPEVAFQLASAAGDYAKAAAIAEQHVDRLFELGRDRTVLGWAEAIWEADGMAPRTFNQAAHVYSLQAEEERSRTWLERARSALELGYTPEYWIRHLYTKFFVWDERGRLERLPEVFQELQERADPENATHQAILKVCGAHLALYIGSDIESAMRMAHEGLQLAYITEDPSLLTHAHVTLGICESLLGRVRPGMAHLRIALQLADEGDMDRRRALLLSNLGSSQLMVGEFDEAIRSVTEGLRLSQQMNRPRDQAACLVSFGDIYRCLGMPDQSTRYYKSAMEVSWAVNDHDWQGYCKAKIAANYRIQGQMESALSSLRDRRYESGLKFYELETQVQKIGILEFQNAEDVTKSVERIVSSPLANAIAKTEALVLGAEKLWMMGVTEKSEALIGRALCFSEEHETEMVIASEAFSKPQLAMLVTQVAKSQDRGQRVGEYLEAISDFNSASVVGSPEGLIDLSALGSVEIRLDGEIRSDLRPLHLEVLFYLVDKKNVPRDGLREVYWGDLNPRQQGTNANTAIHAIRKVLGSRFVETKGGSYIVSPSVDLHYDVTLFEHYLKNSQLHHAERAGKKDALLQAFQLYRGEFMPGYSSKWVLQRRRELEAQYLWACHELATLLVADNAFGQASEIVRRARQVDRYDERLMVLQLTVLKELGRLTQAVREYRLYVKRLAEDLQLSPSAELSELFGLLTESRGGSHWMLETGT